MWFRRSQWKPAGAGGPQFWKRRMRWARPKPVLSKLCSVLQISEKSPQRSSFMEIFRHIIEVLCTFATCLGMNSTNLIATK